MAEIAAGAVVAEQVVSTTIQAGLGYTVAKPSLPLKASFAQIATASADGTRYVRARAAARLVSRLRAAPRGLC